MNAGAKKFLQYLVQGRILLNAGAKIFLVVQHYIFDRLYHLLRLLRAMMKTYRDLSGEMDLYQIFQNTYIDQLLLRSYIPIER